jgi:hypothetical protein
MRRRRRRKRETTPRARRWQAAGDGYRTIYCVWI